MRLIFKNLNILRSTLNAISATSDIKEFIESVGTNLPPYLTSRRLECSGKRVFFSTFTKRSPVQLLSPKV